MVYQKIFQQFMKEIDLKHKNSEVLCQEFWIKLLCGDKYPKLKKLPLKLCTMFGSTYVCEAVFSKMNFIYLVKTKKRSRLTNDHLQDLMSIACTNLIPDFRQIVQTKKCHFSP
ncbi:unnamed protein product [Parnassius mnemosyne]|uniref:HAT C-terminal dimerisation domain-containing protein n=1 Tax=Parnassius mnemosyne TaxID=213953 RepID=A0AAV1K5Z5_9NEOP